jgi:hypothetical protein
MNVDAYKSNIINIGRFGKTPLSKKSNMICNGIGIVGTLVFVINSLFLYGSNTDEIYVDMSDEWKNRVGVKYNPYDYILNQKKDKEYVNVSVWGHHLDNLNDPDLLSELRKQLKYLNFNSGIIDVVNKNSETMELGGDTLGVHIRLTDMNLIHGKHYGYVYFDDYVKAVDQILNNNNVKNIFIAADNHESIKKLKNRYSNICYIENIYRTELEDKTHNSKNKGIGYDKFNSVEDIISPFYDVFALSKCGYLIGRKYSTFRIFALILSNIKNKNNIIELM